MDYAFEQNVIIDLFRIITMSKLPKKDLTRQDMVLLPQEIIFDIFPRQLATPRT